MINRIALLVLMFSPLWGCIPREERAEHISQQKAAMALAALAKNASVAIVSDSNDSTQVTVIRTSKDRRQELEHFHAVKNKNS